MMNSKGIPNEFIVIRNELLNDWPIIWRVDGRNLLQKYEPFQQNNKTLYRAIATYSSWTAENRKLYIKVPIQIRNDYNRHEPPIEFLRNKLDDTEFYIENRIENTVAYQDNFEVYIQTLISQALDANFLTEIMQEQDEYFLSNVKTIDDITVDRKRRLHNICQWSPTIVSSLETWPCYNITSDLSQANTMNVLCVSCGQTNAVIRLILYGQPYNPITVAAVQPDYRIIFNKDMFLCSACSPHVELFHKIAHQKYLMYVECAKKVAEKNALHPMKGTTAILNELLADDVWLAQLFRNVRHAWAEVDNMERRERFRIAAQ